MLTTTMQARTFLASIRAIICIGAIAIVSVGCDSGDNSSAAAESAIEQASRSQQQARKLGHAWTISQDYIELARTQLAQGSFDAALESAQLAQSTADSALKQAAEESAAWEARVPKL